VDNNSIIWLLGIFIFAYWSVCLLAGFFGSQDNKTARDYFIAGRSLSAPMFIMAATATSFSGWTFISHPGLIYAEGFPAAYASFYAITIPLAGVFFLKRQWMLGQRCGFVTPGEMFAAYYQSPTIRYFVVVVAILFSLLYIAVQIRASGFLLHILTQSTGLPNTIVPFIDKPFIENGQLTIESGMIILSIFMMIYVVMGGLRGVALADTIQAVLLAVGIFFLGWLVLDYVGGWTKLLEGIKALSHFESERNKIILQGNGLSENYDKYTMITNWIQWVPDKAATPQVDKLMATIANWIQWINPQSNKVIAGSHWTGMFILTFMIALMGIQSSPDFSMWAFATKDPKAFAFQQVWASAFIMGFLLFFFTAIQGIGGHLLGADIAFREAYPELTKNLLGVFLNDDQLSSMVFSTEPLVPLLIRMMADSAPWLTAGLAVCALAALQSTAAPYMSTVGSMISRDLINVMYKNRKHENLSDNRQIFWARVSTIVITLFSLWIAIHATDVIVYLGGLAVAFGLQMAPALIGICWFPFFTRKGIIAGLFVGLLAVFLTEGIVTGEGKFLESWVNWGQWPYTIHSAGWGITFNLLTVFVVSFLFKKNKEQRAHRDTYHTFFKQNTSSQTSTRKKWGVVAFVIIWALFAIGPFATIGNSLFGKINEPDTWLFSIPPIWIWQILWWVIGVYMIYMLAYKMQFSTSPRYEIEPLRDDVNDEHPSTKITPQGREYD